MRAAAIDRFGGPAELCIHDLDDPLVPPDGLLVRVAAAGVNPVDAKVRQGALAGAFPCFFPLVPGWDLAGTVEQAGPATSGFSPGDPVLAYARKDHIRDGTYAELATVRSYHAAHAGSLPLTEAGGLPLAGLTAFQCLHEGLKVRSGETIVVRGASGGVGQMAVQLALVAGCRVVGIAGSGSEDVVRALGAHDFAPHDGDPSAAIAGADALLDLAGPDGLPELAAGLADGGRVCSVLAPAPPDGLGDRPYSYVFVRPDGAQLAHLAALCQADRLKVTVVEEFGLDDAAAAHQRMEGGGVHGKLVIRP